MLNTIGNQIDPIWREADRFALQFRVKLPCASRSLSGEAIVCGTVLLKQDAAEWRDVLLFRDPA
jgi:hypothetical protein